MSYATTGTDRPTGVTLIVFLNAFFSIIGYAFLIFASVFGFASLGLGAEGGSFILLAIALSTIFTFLYMVLLYGLYQMNRTAYYIFMIVTALILLSNLLSFNIIGLFIQGAMFIYLLLVADKFRQ